MAKKKLLWIGDCVIPSGFGRVTESILTRLADKYDVNVLGVNYFNQEHNFKFNIFSASTKGGPSDPYGFEYVEDIYKAIKPDIIVAFNDVWILHVYWQKLKDLVKKDDVKWINYFPVDGGGWFEPVVKWMEDVDLCVTYTDYAINVIKEAGYEGKIVSLPHGVDTSIFNQMDRQQTRRIIGKMKEDDFIVFNGNRNQPRKRIDLTIMAFAKFAVDKPNAKLYLHMGTKDVGWDIIPLFNNEMKKYGLESEGRLYLSGMEMSPEKNTITPDVLNIIYNSVDVGVNTSEGEGWGLVPFEHAACGVPQIVPNYSASAEIFEDCGSLVDIIFMGKDVNYGIDRAYISVDSMVEQLNKLYYDKKFYEDRSKKCFDMTQDPNYNWDNVAKKMSKYIQSTFK
jgi:glycosyltransferase involved in cell wall biosynthesis